MFNGLFGYLMKDDAAVGCLVGFGYLGQMPGDGFSLAVGVSSQIYDGGVFSCLLKFFYNFTLIARDYVFGGKTLFNVDP